MSEDEIILDDTVQDFMLNIGNDFPEIWILLKQELEYNDVDTKEYKLARYILDAIRLYINVTR